MLSAILVTIFFVFLLAPVFVGYVFGREIEGCRVIEHSRLMRVLGLKGLAIYPVVFVEGAALTAKQNSTVLLNHEKIHLAQQAELFVLPFYLLYLVEAKQKEYVDISFEREAFENERRSSYLKTRQRFAWRKY